MRKYLVFDIGGTDLKYAIINRQGTLIVSGKIPTIKTSLAAFIQSLQAIIDRYVTVISGIAVSVPGKVQHPQEVIEFGGMLPFLDGVQLSQLLKAPVPLIVENDGKAATLAELWRGNLKAVNNGAVLVLGTAVGGGIVLNHQLVRGTHDQAGELSFMKAGTTFAPTEMYGAKGSAVGMIKAIATAIGLPDITDGPAVFAALTAGDVTAWTIFNQYCDQIAGLIQNVQAVVDVDTIVIGGGIAVQPLVTATINAAFDRLRAASPMIRDTLARPKIMTSHYHSMANLYGALYQLLLETETIKYA
ncbi:ROK family protein [Lactiplantibacillus songbeiensis]|uniref:ROK family protein n=1 Tax=Lactiplantibacillus songbeiensis TaxID=2559920 RepID=A0ABW4BYI7_9LACO|nr:ROK family protein [Lactiplantibacillus songbeiensis]